jgi:uncharacterized membrane protein
MKKLIAYFVKGLLIFVPITLTVFLLIWVFNSFDAVFKDRIPKYFPGLGLLISIVLIFAIGFFASNFLGRKLFGFIDRIFTGLPLIKLLYSAVKDILNAFAGEKRSFDRPVLVSIGFGSKAKGVGFITRESLENIGLSDYVAVYIPQSYNFGGNVFLFPKDAIEPLKIESSQAMAFIVSGGLSGDV